MTLYGVPTMTKVFNWVREMLFEFRKEPPIEPIHPFGVARKELADVHGFAKDHKMLFRRGS